MYLRSWNNTAEVGVCIFQNNQIMEDRPTCSRKDCIRLLQSIFGEPELLLKKLAPHGWEQSQLFRVFHPTPEEQLQKALDSHEILMDLRSKSTKSDEPPSPAPSLEDFLDKPDEVPVKPLDELIDILGHCVWHVFSENHDVVDAEGNAYHLGSWRGSARFIAEFINQHHAVEKEYDYMDFYMGFWREEAKANCLPVFKHIFETLHEHGCDWIYSFPSMHLISFDKGDDRPDDPATYDPAKSMEAELEKENRQADVEKFQAELDDIRETEMEKARYSPPPPVVEAYREVFGRLPEGFPGG